MTMIWRLEFFVSTGKKTKCRRMLVGPTASILRQIGAEAPLAITNVFRSTRDRDQVDYVWAGLLGHSKKLQRKPEDVGRELIGLLESRSEALGESHPLFSRLSISSHGHLQVKLSSRYLFASLRAIAEHQASYSPSVSLFAKDKSHSRRTIVDFASPNYAKLLHVGHFRSIVQGESISRILEALGHQVNRLSHVGDFGTPIGLVIASLANRYGEGATIERFEELPLSDIYTAAKQQAKSDEDFLQQALHYCSLLQLRLASAPTHELSLEDMASLEWAFQIWLKICEVSRRSFDAIAEQLDISVTERGESFYAPLIAPIIEDLAARSLVQSSQGALVAFLDDPVIRAPMLVRKKDNSYLYATTDIACLKQRVDVEQAEWIVYITDLSQRPHFQAVFELARRAGYLPAHVRVDHVGLGLVRTGDDKKKVSSRDGVGKDATLQSLLRAAVDAAKARSPPDLAESSVATLGLSALRYFDLSHHNNKDYVFSTENMLSWKGNTSSYIMYAYTRASAILRNLGGDTPKLVSFDTVQAPASARTLDSQHERELALQLISVGDSLLKIETSLSPHVLCEHLYEIATAFHVFYSNCPVLDCPDADQRLTRLLLVQATVQMLRQGFYLLGINDPTERM